MMTVLQNLRDSTQGVKHNKTSQEIVDALQTPEKPNTKYVLKFRLFY